MHIVITGASRGIGAALRAHYLAQGHHVTGTSRAGGDDLLALDVTDPAAHGRLAAALGDRPVDLLICNAGIYTDKGQSLDTGYPVPLWATPSPPMSPASSSPCRRCCRIWHRPASQRSPSFPRRWPATPARPAAAYYPRASKAAALNLGRNLSADLAPRGIAVGIYHPGWVQTDMGGATAEITVDQSAEGLIARFASLSLDTTGCFETWDGRAHPY